MWTNDDGFDYNDYYLSTIAEEWLDAELLDYQNSLYLRLLQLTNNLWMTCLKQQL